ncbi:hypothetical protein SAMN05444339_10274 [Loktanella atrilutea]|uniref:Uncharacterized protein n=1 Tax=Loktanella atrilutea TaxID=366533 RepID=A0A1M4WD53_LOKAT|nr:hypothetical protein [Loktanella atrilutea]SHE79169.1 hypothetical protein SAMN05444339_10274 [Loktanella atrilutea]
MKYRVKTEGFIYGTFYNVNKHIDLTERQAQTFLAEGRLEPVPVKAASKTESAKADAVK